MSEPILYGILYSPWSAKARWALDHQGVSYTYREYLPMLGEPMLRLRARGTGTASVPLLVTTDGPIGDSYQIAKYADRIGTKAPLVPSELSGEVDAWNTRAEAVLTSGRARSLLIMADDDEALSENVPSFIPKALRGLAKPAVRATVQFVAKKYGGARSGDEIASHLDALRDAVGTGGRHLVGERFSFADIAMACALQFVAPVDPRFIKLRSATAKTWRNDALAKRYEDLLAWRDAMFSDFRFV